MECVVFCRTPMDPKNANQVAKQTRSVVSLSGTQCCHTCWVLVPVVLVNFNVPREGNMNKALSSALVATVVASWYYLL